MSDISEIRFYIPLYDTIGDYNRFIHIGRSIAITPFRLMNLEIHSMHMYFRLLQALPFA